MSLQRRPRLSLVRPALAAVSLVSLLWPVAALAQKPAPPAVSRDSAEGPAWSTLTPAQKATLAPLQRDWSGIDGLRKQKWLELAEKYQTMPAADRQRVQERMTAWSRLTPEERSRARLQYQQARQLPAQDRQQQWDAYQALPSDEKAELANRSKASREAATAPRTAKPAAAASPSAAPVRPMPKVVAPAVVQAKPGASTTLISNAPAAAPPAPPGKIVAPPGQVDRSTLLPKVGRQDTAPGNAGATPAARTQP